MRGRPTPEKKPGAPLETERKCDSVIHFTLYTIQNTLPEKVHNSRKDKLENSAL